MTEEYRIIEEADEHRLLIEEAQMVGENINALLAAIYCIWDPSLEELEKHVPYPHLTKYALNIMEGMGLVSRSDLDDLERDGTGTDEFSRRKMCVHPLNSKMPDKAFAECAEYTVRVRVSHARVTAQFKLRNHVSK